MEKDQISTNPTGIVALVAHWSNIFGLPINTIEEFPEGARIALAIKLIDEEFMETLDGIDNKNIEEVKDGLGDLLWVTIRAMMEFGINPEETIKAIYDSNMSKADTTLEDATTTYHKYKEQGIETYSKEVQGLFITYRTLDNKVLKSHKFKSPEL
jgi:hypothetical protein